jgi:hypothetical protein
MATIDWAGLPELRIEEPLHIALEARLVGIKSGDALFMV